MSQAAPALESFASRLARDGRKALTRDRLETLQVNLGKLCNQTCAHCHVNAGPGQTQANMDLETVQQVIAFSRRGDIRIVDITGGAPELNPNFRFLVESMRGDGRRVMDRCNLTVLFEPGQEDLARFLADHGVELICSLPCYLEENVDAQRGDGVYQKSIRGLELLNELGYGDPGTGLVLNLVYNPGGAFLPPPQEMLEGAYKKELHERFGIRFDHLFAFTNLPLGRFAATLKAEGKLQEYMQVLVEAYNPAAVDPVMCRSLVSVGWDGSLYDCDFNQMLGLCLGEKKPLHIGSVKLEELLGREILLGDHCYGCTAGAGSSCGGTLV